MDLLRLSKPAAGERTNVLWKHVAKLVDAVAALQRTVAVHDARLPRRRPMDSAGGTVIPELYDPEAAYAVGDWVVVIGAGQGTYVCQIAHTPVYDAETETWSGAHAPWLGEYDGTGQYWAVVVPSAEGFWGPV